MLHKGEDDAKVVKLAFAFWTIFPLASSFIPTVDVNSSEQ